MAEGLLLSPELYAQIRELWNAWKGEFRNPDAGHRRQSPINESESLQGILAGTLAAATDPVDGQATATLNVYYRDADGELVDADRTITVTNRDTSLRIGGGCYCVVKWIEGEWRPDWTQFRVCDSSSSSSSGCEASSFGVALADIPGWNAAAQQVLSHDANGCLTWLDVESCEEDSSSADSGESGCTEAEGTVIRWDAEVPEWTMVSGTFECPEGFEITLPDEPGAFDGEERTAACCPVEE